MMYRFGLITAILLGWGTSCTYAQIRTSSIDVEQWVKNNFGGQGVVIGNIKHSGNQQAFASFTSTENILQLQRGLIISTGTAIGVGGANTAFNYSTAFGQMKGAEEDKDLSPLLSHGLYDISFIEFDFVPLANRIQFSYQFGSEEYPEYVGSAYNDIFAFFVADEKSTRNIAVIPGKNVPVSVNTINGKTESDRYIDNNVFSQVVFKRQGNQLNNGKRWRTLPGRVLFAIKRFLTYESPDESPATVQIRTDPGLMKTVSPDLYRNLQFDGITKRLQAFAYVEPYKKYRMKIIIADVADNVYDSGVFIEDQSFEAKKDEKQPNFVNYPDLSNYLDARKLLEGKELADILPASFAPENSVIYFDFDDSELKPAEMQKLKSISRLAGQLQPAYRLKLTGHTDSIGNLSYNMALSKRRNQAVMDSLVKINSAASIYNSSEMAFMSPAAPNTTDEGRGKNRRVEILFVKDE